MGSRDISREKRRPLKINSGLSWFWSELGYGVGLLFQGRAKGEQQTMGSWG
jgi:hypothetical protein